MKRNTLALPAAIVALACVAAPGSGRAENADTLGEIISKGAPTLDLRLRQESVDDDNFSRNADALTLRARLGFKTATYHGFTAFVEAEGIDALNNRYNSTKNGKTGFPTVADPQGTEWNQAWLGWDSGSGSQLSVGRQRIILDNHRFVGNVGWRQNEQTFDAIAASHAFADQTTLRYYYLDQVNRVFGNENPNPLLAEWELDAHLVNLSRPFSFGTLTGYGYLIDNQDLPLTSTQTFGLRLSGARPFGEGYSFGYSAEYANQSDYAGGRSSNDADYYLAEASISLPEKHAFKLGYEELSGDGVYGFQTPLATLHAFNGWADRFLSTPVDGLQDIYAGISGPLGKLNYALIWHNFDPSHGGGSYGSEWDGQLSYAFAKRWLALLKYASYNSDGFNRDTDKLWASIEFKL